MIKELELCSLYNELKRRESPFMPKIEETYDYAKRMLPEIRIVFRNYTDHDIRHSMKIMEYMYSLVEDISRLSELDLVLMIYSALLHDIGMIVTPEEEKNIKEYEHKYLAIFKEVKDEKLALQEYVRPIHGKRAQKFINEQMKEELFIVPNTSNISFKDEVGKICRAHDEEFIWLKGNLKEKVIKEEYTINPQFIAILLRLSDLIDIDATRTPIYLYEIIKPLGYSDLEWKKHFDIQNTHKIVKNEETGIKVIEFHGTSSNPKVHRKILRYFDYVNEEICNDVSLSEGFKDKIYRILLRTTIEDRIDTIGFEFSDFKLNLDYNAVTNLLMGENIYGNKRYGLREIIQNSIDACNLMKEIADKKDEYMCEEYNPCINIIFDRDKEQVVIKDNGIGMSIDIIKRYFLNIGCSYYKSKEYKYNGYKYNAIGNYGIGFLACFMLSDKVIVRSRYTGEDKLYEIEIEKESEYICVGSKQNSDFKGTEIILDYSQFIAVFPKGIDDIKLFIEKNFIDTGIRIRAIDIQEESKKVIDITLNNQHLSGNKVIEIDKYLNDITCSIQLKRNKINFISDLSQVNGNHGYIYIEETGELKDIASKVNIIDYIEDNKLSYLVVLVVEEDEEEEFQKNYEVLEDLDETLERINDYYYINIYAKNINKLKYRVLPPNGEYILIDKLKYSKFLEQFEACECPEDDIRMKTESVITGNSSKILLESRLNRDTCKAMIFVKNVYIRDAQIAIPYLISGFSIEDMILNINCKDVIPNVARNNLTESIKEKLGYSVGRAIHLWILDNMKLSEEERNLVNKFIETYYNQSTEILV